MSDLGMGEDQGKIDALKHASGENLATFFSERSHLSFLIKRGAEQSFTSHSAKIKALELCDWNNVGMRMKGYALSVGLDVVASHSFFVGSGGWVGNMGRAGYGQCPNRRASSKLGFLGVLDVGCCSQPASRLSTSPNLYL